MSLPRVLCYPPRHPYVDRLRQGVAHLPHRNTEMPRISNFYDVDWIADHAHEFDIAHLHFGHEQYPIAHVVEVLESLREHSIPVAMTVHDLQIPHLQPDDHYATDMVRRAAPLVDAFCTLTAGCATEVQALAGRPVSVVRHGPLTPLSRRKFLRARQPVTHLQPWLLHAGRLRPNLGWREVVSAYRAVKPLRPLRIQVRDDCAAQVRQATGRGSGITVVSHSAMTHPQLEESIADAAALLLPYRWGTHSGLLELAADVGTAVVTTEAGFMSEQHPVVSVSVDNTHRVAAQDLQQVFDNDSAMKDPRLICDDEDRHRDATTFSSYHRRMYRALLGSAGGP